MTRVWAATVSLALVVALWGVRGQQQQQQQVLSSDCSPSGVCIVDADVNMVVQHTDQARSAEPVHANIDNQEQEDERGKERPKFSTLLSMAYSTTGREHKLAGLQVLVALVEDYGIVGYLAGLDPEGRAKAARLMRDLRYLDIAGRVEAAAVLMEMTVDAMQGGATNEQGSIKELILWWYKDLDPEERANADELMSRDGIDGDGIALVIEMAIAAVLGEAGDKQEVQITDSTSQGIHHDDAGPGQDRNRPRGGRRRRRGRE